MSQIWVRRIVWGLGLLTAMACGGMSVSLVNDPIPHETIRQRIEIWMNVVNSRNLASTSYCYSQSYLDDCVRYDDVVAAYKAEYADPNYVRTLSDLHMRSQRTDGLEGEATYTYKLREDRNGVVTTSTVETTSRFYSYAISWLFYGNQQCSQQP